MAETPLTIRLAAQEQHRSGAHYGGQRQVVESPLRPAGFQAENRLVAHPMLPILAVVDLGHQLQLHPAVRLGSDVQGEDALGLFIGQSADSPASDTRIGIFSITPEAAIS